jgi:4-cresol dehydrogenase (hydroxylating)
MLCCLPILPANGPDIQKATEILDSIERDFGIIPAATLNPLNDLYLESVVNIYFDRTEPAAVELAHKANDEMIKRFYEVGFRFYRFDVKSMHDYIDGENPHWKLVSKLKEALDPNRIFSPGRYEAQL